MGYITEAFNKILLIYIKYFMEKKKNNGHEVQLKSLEFKRKWMKNMKRIELFIAAVSKELKYWQ